MIENIVDVIYIINTSIKSKKTMYKEICIYKGNNSCIDNEEQQYDCSVVA